MLSRLTSMFLVAGFGCMAACTPVALQSSQPRELSRSVVWSGDAATFAGVWQHFMPEQALPEVAFENDLVVFSRNLVYYNRTNIFKVTLTAGVAEILAMETMSAMPVEDRVAMAMAVIPRAGVKAIRLDDSTTLAVD